MNEKRPKSLPHSLNSIFQEEQNEVSKLKEENISDEVSKLKEGNMSDEASKLREENMAKEVPTLIDSWDISSQYEENKEYDMECHQEENMTNGVSMENMYDVSLREEENYVESNEEENMGDDASKFEDVFSNSDRKEIITNDVWKLKDVCNQIEGELSNEEKYSCSREYDDQFEMMNILKDMHHLIRDIHGRVTRIEENMFIEKGSNIYEDSSATFKSKDSADLEMTSYTEPKVEKKERKNKIKVQEDTFDFNAKNEKTLEEKNLIRDVINSESFTLRFLLLDFPTQELDKIIDSFRSISFVAGSEIMVQGEMGNYFYIIEKGNFDVIVNDTIISQLQACDSFGDDAILFGCTHTKTIRAKEDCKLWCIHQWNFRNVTGTYNLNRLKFKSDNIRKVKVGGMVLGEVLEPADIENIAFITKTQYFESGKVIFREGDTGSSIYIIEEGFVDVYLKDISLSEPINTLSKGNYFGEKAMFSDDLRQGTCIATCDVKCLVLDRKDFVNMFDDLQSLLVKSFRKDAISGVIVDFSARKSSVKKEIETNGTKIAIEDLDFIKVLGAGTFATIKLARIKPFLQKQKLVKNVHISENQLSTRLAKQKSRKNVGMKNSNSLGNFLSGNLLSANQLNKIPTFTTEFAVKIINKTKICDDNIRNRINSEKEIMCQLTNPFIVHCYQEIQDDFNIYLLLEPMMGGDLYDLLYKKKRFSDSCCKFFAASIIVAFQEIHLKRIAFRDLKLENVVLGLDGFIKLTDFGLAKKTYGEKTWTVCGTPDYLAPEIILNEGHDHAVDYWALGILIYEMMSGQSPFHDKSELNRYKRIVSGRFAAPDNFDPHLMDLIEALLEKNQTLRLGRIHGGARKVMSHEWFGPSFDWNALIEKAMIPPCVEENNDTCISTTRNNEKDNKKRFPIKLINWLEKPKTWLLQG